MSSLLLRAFTKKVDDVFGKFHKTGRKTVSIEQMDAAIKQKIRESFE